MEVRGIKTKYPEAKRFSEMDFDPENERCPFCKGKMNLAIEDGGPYGDPVNGFTPAPLLKDAIGRGANKVRPTFEGEYDGYYEIYYKCPHCGEIFYVTFDV